jgi:hypothetical protein
VVHNGTVVGLSLFNAKILGMGEMYSILVRPDGPPNVELYDVVVMVGGGVCFNNRGHANLGSNTLRISHDARTKKKHNRIEQALGMPRPGAGSLEEAMAARARVLGDARFVQPLAPGQTAPALAEQIQSYTRSMQEPEALTTKIRDATAIYKQLSQRVSNPPSRVVMERLEKELAVLRAVRDRLVAADKMEGKRTQFPRHRHHEDDYDDDYDDDEEDARHLTEELLQEIHGDMDKLKKERESMEAAMQSQREMREALLREREDLRAERDATRRQVRACVRVRYAGGHLRCESRATYFLRHTVS